MLWRLVPAFCWITASRSLRLHTRNLSKASKVDINAPQAVAKRAARAAKRAQKNTPEARLAAQLRANAEAEAKRQERQQRDALEVDVLKSWAPRDSAGQLCQLVDIGANLVKTKDEAGVRRQLQRCALTGVNQILITGTCMDTSQQALAMVSSSSNGEAGVQLYCTAGVHPHDARTADEDTVPALRAMLAQEGCVAVGECGLDYDRMFSPQSTQLHWFEQQVQLAAELQMPLFVHERDRDLDKGEPLGSHDDVLEVLRRWEIPPARVVIHCFTGSEVQLQKYVDKGYLIGLTGFVSLKERGAHVREALRRGVLPLEQLMLETDAPYMKPDKSYLPSIKSLKRGQCEPCCLPAVCAAVAESYQLPIDTVARVTTNTAREFFQLKHGP